MTETLDVRAFLESKQGDDLKSSSVEKEDGLSYDLGHLAAFDPSPIDTAALSEAPEHLLSISRENTQLLINQLFSLPREQKADGAYFSLPAPTTIVPREKPLPKEKPKTRWEKFAEQKGIEKKKRGRLVWDEATQQWAPRYGYKSVTDQAAAVPWIEAKPGDELMPGEDPFQKRLEDKKAKSDKQKRQEARNLREAMTGGEDKYGARKSELGSALQMAQGSSASLGRFDKTLKNEPDKDKGKRRKFEPVSAKEMSDEKQKALNVAERLFKNDTPINSSKAANMVQQHQEAGNRAAKKGKGGAKPQRLLPGQRPDKKGKKGRK